MSHSDPHCDSDTRAAWVLFGLGVGLLFAVPVTATADGRPHEVFQRYKDRVIQVRIVNTLSGTKSSLGSGFVASASGHIITNYHVVSSLVTHPDRYRVEFVRLDGNTGPLTLVDFDVVHDLAVLISSELAGAPLLVRRETPLKGEQLYSMGNPLDLGFTIIDGTYSGRLKNSLYEKLHFTGSINPGMSGGPTIARDGRVVGVNVATSGNQVSFLVPAEHADALLRRTANGAPHDSDALITRLRDQLLTHQRHLFQQLLSKPIVTTGLGDYRVPGRFAPYLECWGDSSTANRQPYRVITYSCSSDDYIFIDAGQVSGSIRFRHRLIRSLTLNRFQLYHLYESFFGEADDDLDAREENVTAFACTTRFVNSGGLTLKVVFCARSYKRLPGLYDAVLKVATLNRTSEGLETSLVLLGVDFAHAVRFAHHYVDAMAWNR